MKSKLLIILLFLGIALHAQEELRKNFKQVYAVTNTDLFDISNQFGTINISNTNSNEISITAEVIVSSRSKDRSQKVLDAINIEISKKGNTIYAITNIDNLNANNVNFEINYNVQMPSYLKLNLKNKYGKVFIDALTNKSNIAVKYGSLQLKSLTDDNDKPLSTIELGYCDNSTVNNLNWAKVILSYSKLTIDEAKALVISSKYSNIKLGTASSCVTESAYDNYSISEITNFVGKGRYSGLNIGTLHKKLNIDTKYGDVKVSKVSKDFEEITVQTAYAGIDITLHAESGYTFEAAANYGDIKYPSIEVYERIKDNQNLQIKGYKGNKDAVSSIKLTTAYGDIRIKQ
jgi:hypothetical protein